MPDGPPLTTPRCAMVAVSQRHVKEPRGLSHPGLFCVCWSAAVGPILERHRRALTNVQMDGPAIDVTNAPSTSRQRLFHCAAARGDVGRTSTRMLTVGSTSDLSVMGLTPVPRHDGQRPASSSSDSLEDLDELVVDEDDAVAPRAAAPELRAIEVRREVTHLPDYPAAVTSVRPVRCRPRRRWVSNSSSIHSWSTPMVVPTRAAIGGRSGLSTRGMAARPA